MLEKPRFQKVLSTAEQRSSRFPAKKHNKNKEKETQKIKGQQGGWIKERKETNDQCS
jgi:hypothetical protein